MQQAIHVQGTLDATSMDARLIDELTPIMCATPLAACTTTRHLLVTNTKMHSSPLLTNVDVPVLTSLQLLNHGHKINTRLERLRFGHNEKAMIDPNPE